MNINKQLYSTSLPPSNSLSLSLFSVPVSFLQLNTTLLVNVMITNSCLSISYSQMWKRLPAKNSFLEQIWGKNVNISLRGLPLLTLSLSLSPRHKRWHVKESRKSENENCEWSEREEKTKLERITMWFLSNYWMEYFSLTITWGTLAIHSLIPFSPFSLLVMYFPNTFQSKWI